MASNSAARRLADVTARRGAAMMCPPAWLGPAHALVAAGGRVVVSAVAGIRLRPALRATPRLPDTRYPHPARRARDTAAVPSGRGAASGKPTRVGGWRFPGCAIHALSH